MFLGHLLSTATFDFLAWALVLCSGPPAPWLELWPRLHHLDA